MPIIIDAHVHIQARFDLDVFFDNAWLNFSQVLGRPKGAQQNSSFILLLTESHGCDVFNTLLEKGNSSHSLTNCAWKFCKTQEKNCLKATNGPKSIIIVAGSQLVSTEKIELLSLFSPLDVRDESLPLEELARFISKNNGLPLIPWGVGKWVGRRGRIVRSFLESPPVPCLLVGDNGNRPAMLPYPALLSSAEKKGLTSLAGSDPLQFATHIRRAGTRGGMLKDAILQDDTPATHLQELLQSAPQIESFGRGVGLFRFFYDQFRANVAKRI